MNLKNLKLPSWASLSLAGAATILNVLNQTSFGFGEPWSTLVTGGLAALAVLGIGPLVHGQLTATLHIPYQTALALATTLATGATGATTLSGISSTWKAVVVGLLTAAGGALVGPAAALPPVPAPPLVPPVPPTPAK